MSKRLIAACDGACKGNPGPAAWGWVLADADEQVVRWESGALGNATNNVAELTALERLLMATDPADDLEVRMDSQYAMNAVTKWLPNWKRNGWKTAAKKPVANQELVMSIDALLSPRKARVKFVYVAAHQIDGDKLNDLADRAASASAISQRGLSGTSAEEVPVGADTPMRFKAAKAGKAAASGTSGKVAKSATSVPSARAATSDAAVRVPAGPSRAIPARYAGKCSCGQGYQPGEMIAKGSVGTWGHQACATA